MSRRIYSWMFSAVMLGAAVGCGPMPEPGEEGADPGESAGELAGAGGLVTIRSGLGWPSGAYSGEGAFMNLRRDRPLDLCLTFGNGTRSDASWREVENQVGAQAKEAFRQGCAKYLFALRIFPADPGSENPRDRGCGIWRNAARGDYDTHYVAMARNLKANAPANMILRIGWELSAENYPWSLKPCTTQEQANWYKEAHQRIHGILKREYSPHFKVAWNFLRDSGKVELPIASYFPGAAYVDVVSIDLYDRDVDYNTPAQFAASAHLGTVERPRGIARWLELAKRLGKPFGVDEWGVNNVASDPNTHGGDNPVFISEMYNFFKAHRQHIAYESYFNAEKHVLGTSLNPKASAKYKAVWTAGP